MEIGYFCYGCQEINEYDQFKMSKDEKKDVYILDCMKCNQATICIKCVNCERLKYCKYDNIFTIIKCFCKSKQRIFECSFCYCPEKVVHYDLKQTSKINCCNCLNSFYIINCPECQHIKILNSIDTTIYCQVCNLKFKIDECIFCKEDAFSFDQTETPIFKCSNHHQYQHIQCVECKKINKIYEIHNQSISCQNCGTIMKQIKCLCGQNQIIKKTTTDQINQFKCTKCSLQYKINKCNTKECSDIILSLNKPLIQANDIGPFNETVNVLCFSCKKLKFISTCLICGQQQPIQDDPKLFQQCIHCNRKFQKIEQPQCTICYDFKADQLFLPCGHLFSCQTCSAKIENRCPQCRQQITHRVRVFYT